jgi:Carboxypeptidase regulatory-like domain
VNRIRLLSLLALPLIFLAVASAQTTTTGSISGVITDSSGAVIPKAKVELRNSATGALETTQSNSVGAYRFDLLPPGPYAITVNQPGFSTMTTSLVVANSQVVDADLKLQIGTSRQTVEVTAQEELLQAEDANVEATIQQSQMTEIPNSGNNLLFETRITPGFVNTQFGVAGSTTQYQIDGDNYNDPYNNANNSGASNLTLGLDDIQETSVTANGYSGQFGGLAGSSVSYTSKSGGNQLHGDATWYWTGSSMIANTFLHKVDDTPRTFENANQWAAQISGPVVIPHLFNGHNKLFFLADAEGLRAVLPGAASTVAVPSANLQAYALSTLTNADLTASIPYYQNIFNLYNAAAKAHNAVGGDPSFSGPAANTGCGTLNATDATNLGVNPTTGVGPTGACADYYESTAASFANEALEIFRVDANIGPNDKAYIRFEYDTGTQPTYIDPINPIFNAISIQPQYDGQFNETHTFGTRVVNNFIMTGLWYGALFGPSNLAATTAAFPAELAFGDSSFATLGGEDYSFPTGRNISTAQFQDDIAINEGVHTLKFGVKAYLIKENDHYFTANTVPEETVPTLSAFINGGYDPSSYSTKSGTYSEATTFAQGFPERPNYPVFENQLAGYAEDDWKATRSLNLTLTLRAEHQGNISCMDNCLTELSAPFVSLNHGASIPYNQAYVFNQNDVLPGLQTIEMQPRFGFAYNPSFMESLVVRGGAGFFYNGLASSILEGIAKNPPLKPSFSVSQDHLANSETTGNLYADTQAYDTAFVNGIKGGETEAQIQASLPTASERNAFTPPNVYTSQANFHMYYVEKWNLEVQKLFGSNTSLDVNYLGNHGVHAPFTNAGLNAYSASGAIAGLPGVVPDPRFGIVYYYTSGGLSNYDGLVTTFVHRFSQQSTFTAGYTYGKTMSTGANGFSTSTSTGTTDIGAPPDPYHPLAFYAPDSTDQRHTFTANYVYKAPWNNPFYGQWEVSGMALAYSGLAFTAIDTKGSSSISSYSTGNYGASLTADYKGGGEASCGVYANACLTSSEFGSATSVGLNGPRNSWRGPDYYDTDFNVTKFVPLHWEGGTFSVSLEAFNVLNHPDFSKPTGSLSSGSFGKVTSTINPSGIFSGVGGDDSPRIVQFKTKIIF